MNALILVVLTYFAFVLETSVVPQLGWGVLAPRLVPAVLVWIVWRSHAHVGLLVAAGWGLVADGLSQGPLGIEVVSFVVAAWQIQFIRARRSSPSSIMAAAVSGLVVLAVLTVSASVHAVAERQTVSLPHLAAQVAGAALPTAVLAAGLILIGRRPHRSQGTGASSAPHVSNQWRMLTE